VYVSYDIVVVSVVVYEGNRVSFMLSTTKGENMSTELMEKENHTQDWKDAIASAGGVMPEFEERVINAYGCIVLEGKERFVTDTLRRGTVLKIHKTGLGLIAEAADNKIYKVSDYGRRSKTIGGQETSEAGA
jgi:hypothetical protein